MLRPNRRLFGVVLVLSATLLLGGPVVGGPVSGYPVAGTASTSDAPARGTSSAAARPKAHEPRLRLPERVHGRAAVAALGDQLDEVADTNDMRPRELSSLLREDPTAWLSTSGAVYFADPAQPAPGAVAAPSAAAAPLDQTFDLHSKPGSEHTIFLDFDGADVGGTWWTLDFPALDPEINGWDPAKDGAAFSASERVLIQDVWAMVADDFAPFDVDVTTADPGPDAIYHETMADTEYGVQVLIGDNPQANQVLCDNTCSGVAFRGGEATNTFLAGDAGYGSSTASFVFPSGQPNAQRLAKTASHEVGHQMSLQHDGDSYGAYSHGQGIWVPIMGVSNDRPMSQWSAGEYPDATNRENDLAMISGHLGRRGDESGPRLAEAAPVPTGAAYITDPGDQDTYLLGRCVGSVDLAATTARSAANLDIELTLRTAAGVVVATDDPSSTSAGNGTFLPSGLNSRIATPVDDGYYYLTVDGVGNGDWQADGYGDYGSLGAYTLDVGSACDGAWPTGVTSQPGTVTATRPDDNVANTVTVSWAAPSDTGASDLTGYVVMAGGDVVDVPAGTTSYTWTGLGYSTPYTFQVVAMNDHGPSHAAAVDFTTPRHFVPPSAPTGLAAGYDPASRAATLTWSVPDDDGGKPVTGYDVFLGDTQATSLNDVITAPASDVVVASVDASARSAVVSGLVPTKYNYLRVRAKNVIGDGASPRGVMIQPLGPPANDAFAARKAVTGTRGGEIGDTTHATGEPGDPVPPHERSGAGDSSVWFSWTAPASRVVTFDTGVLSDDGDVDTTLGVYTGSALDDLELVAGNDDRAAGEATSRLRFDAVEGTTYAIAVDGYRGVPAGINRFRLSWQMAFGTEMTFRATPVSHQRVALSASVNPGGVGVGGGGSPAGSVEFRQDGALVGTVPVDMQQARLVLTDVAGGEHTYTAVFVPDDTAVWAPSTTGAQTIQVLGNPTSPDFQVTVVDEAVTLAATFGAGATGQVRFRDGATEVTTVDIVDGVAVHTMDPAPEGTHSYAADYLPDTVAFEPATSEVRTVTVLGRPTTTVSTTVDKALVTVEVHVTGRAVAPTGWVRLREGGALVADPAQVVNGKARFVLGQVPAGDHAWTASYAPDSSPHTGSTSTGTATVALWATRTTLQVERTRTGGASLTAWADDTVAGGRLPGAIQLLDNGEPIDEVVIADGTATTSIAFVRPGEHSYSARFVPADATAYDESVSAGSTPFTVATGSSSVFLEPTVTKHQVALLAKVSATLGHPDGTVTVVRDGKVVQTLDVTHGLDATEGRARFVFDDVRSGRYSFTATYTPNDALHTGSGHTQAVVVGASSTDIVLQVETDPTRRAHVLTARVASKDWSGLPGGTVTFYDRNLQVGTPVPVVDGAARLDLTGVGTGDHAYRATFMPASFDEFNISSTQGFQPASMPLSPTSTSLATTAEGQTVTLRARVSSDFDVPSGSQVEFTDQGGTVGTAMVGSDGVATRVLTGVRPGAHTYAATFRDDGWQQVYADSASDPVTLTVVADEAQPDPIPVATTTSLSASVTGRSVTLDAAVTDGSTRAGRVVFYDGDLALDVVAVSGGAARLVLGDVSVGVHRYRAEFVPDDPSVEVGSGSGTREVTVQPTPTTTTLTGAVSGTSVTLTAAVDGGNPAYLVGSVIIYDGAQQLTSYAISGGSRTAVVVVSGSVGQHSYRAQFVPGTADFVGSTSEALSLTVKPVVVASKTTLTAPRNAKAGSRPVVRIRVSRGSAAATGAVVLKVGSKKVKLALKGGRASYKLPKVRKGTLKLTATYATTATTKGSAARTSIKVRR